MKNKSLIFRFILLGLLILLTFGCSKDDDDNGLVTDIDGNVYHTVKIGTQVWMVENLRTTRYNDDTNIPNIMDNDAWDSATTPGYCWYNNDKAHKSLYGALYNWYTVNTGKICPKGWHVPTDAEWTTLTTYLGGDGGKLKEMGTTHWNSPNKGATNESGFSALPGGYRHGGGVFSDMGYDGSWWSSTEDDTYDAWDLCLIYNYSIVFRESSYKMVGISVRCVKD